MAACDICFESYTSSGLTMPLSLPCGHTLCKRCATDMHVHHEAESTKLCPTCRAPFPAAVEALRPNFAVISMVENGAGVGGGGHTHEEVIHEASTLLSEEELLAILAAKRRGGGGRGGGSGNASSSGTSSATTTTRVVDARPQASSSSGGGGVGGGGRGGGGVVVGAQRGGVEIEGDAEMARLLHEALNIGVGSSSGGGAGSATSSSFACVSVHEHPLQRGLRSSGTWGCDGRQLFAGGCKQGCTGFGQTAGWQSWTCLQCDFDLCEGCKNSVLIGPPQMCPQGHAMRLVSTSLYTSGVAVCDLCRARLGSRGGEWWHCDSCKCEGYPQGIFDACLSCRPKITSPSSATAATAAASSSVSVSVHPHVLQQGLRKNGAWACDGRMLPGGCRKGCTGFNQTAGWKSFTCLACDFDLCEGCKNAYI